MSSASQFTHSPSPAPQRAVPEVAPLALPSEAQPAAGAEHYQTGWGCLMLSLVILGAFAALALFVALFGNLE